MKTRMHVDPSHRKKFALVFILVCCTVWYTQSAWALISTASNSTIYYDADEINLDKKTGDLKAQGNAFLLIGNVFVSAHKVQYDKQLNILIAEGGVRIVRKRERIAASRVLLNEVTGEARMDDVEIYADPADTDAKVNEEVLGFSKAELAFEVARRAREQELVRQLELIRIQSLNQKLTNSESELHPHAELKKTYARVLERLIRTRHQPNDALRDLPDDARIKIENRREAVRSFASKDPQLAQRIAGLQQVPGFLTMRAKRVYQNSDQTLDVEYAAITTCRCDAGENAAWGLSASRAFVEPYEYITLYGATLEVSSFPIVYTPWFKMPIKTKRQAGFLLPSLYLSRSGDAISIPYFVPFGDSADTTFTFTHFSKKGPRAELELRAALSESSQHNFKLEVLQDKTTPQDEKKNRWSWMAQNSLPLSAGTTVKINAERASDQKYYADLTKEPGATQDLFTPQIEIKRFLAQQVALEQSSENYSLGIQVQSPQDVFLENLDSTPRRIPRLEFSLFPRNIGNTFIFYDLEADYERIEQLQNRTPATLDNELRGERSSALARLNYPIRSNRFYNANIGLELGNINYSRKSRQDTLLFPASTINVDIPLLTDFSNRENIDGSKKFRHTITPFSSIRWIPTVKRSGSFPDIYSTFYASDNIARSQTLNFGFRTSLQFLEEEFQLVENSIESSDASGKTYASAGQEATLFELLGYTGDRNSTAAGDFLFSSTLLQNNPAQVFEKWAQIELEQYASDRNNSFTHNSPQTLAVSNKSWRRSMKTHAHLLQLSASTSYNFEAEKTASEQNKNLRPGQTPVSSDPWGELSSSVALSAEPWMPVSSSFVQHWKPSWNRFRERTASIHFKGRFGIALNLTHSKLYSEAVNSAGEKWFPSEQLWGVVLNYQPKSWVRFQYQHRHNTKPQPAASPELEYSALQKVSFLGIQDCVDIILQRFKDRDVKERMATWTLGLNLNFLGQQRPIESLGKVVDRAIKSQLNR